MGSVNRFCCLACAVILSIFLLAGPASASEQSDILRTESSLPSYLDWLDDMASSGAEAYKGRPLPIEPESSVLPADNDYDYEGHAYLLSSDKPTLTYSVTVPENGLYELSLEYYVLPDGISDFGMTVEVNGQTPYSELKSIVLPRYWLVSDESGLLNPQNDAAWRKYTLMDSTWKTPGTLLLYLTAGENTIDFKRHTESALIGLVTLRAPGELPSYNEYRAGMEGESYKGDILVTEAENPVSKRGTSISVLHDSDPLCSPQSATDPQPNTIGGRTWRTGGESIIWNIETEQAGFYRISFKYLNNFKINMPVFRTIRINGEIPFRELSAYAFPFQTDWANLTLSSEDGTAYEIWLDKGVNTLELIAVSSPYSEAALRISKLIKQVNDLYIELKMVTGNQQDYDRDWKIENFCPDAVERLEAFAGEFDDIYNELGRLSGRAPDAVRNLKLCAEQIRSLVKDPDKIMVRYGMLSEDSGSILQMAGEVQAELDDQSLKLDRIYVHGDSTLPRTESNFFERLAYSLRNLFHKLFTLNRGSAAVSADDHEMLEVWVTRSRQYVNVAEAMTVSDFTKKTGINVSYSLLTDEGKLTLAIAADDAPDVVQGVSWHIPFNLALRNALYDLKNFDDYNDVIGRYAPGAVLPYIYDGGTYALPETQYFYALIYRTDILNGLGLQVPDTWDDVINMLPVLQRNGMNFYLPLSSGTGLKPFYTTLPFFYQNNADLFSEDGTRTVLDSENSLAGMKLMTKLYTIYNVPLQVPSLYNKFRSGEIPVAICDFSTYLQILTAAPEIAGSWALAPAPGIRQDDGTVARWQCGASSSVFIMADSDLKEEAWKFLSWWSEDDVQTKYGNTMFSLYGNEFTWNTANLKAFAGLPWPEEHKAAILEQWKWLKDTINIPGSYMLEREISDAWNRIVFNGVNERRAIDDAVINTNREIRRKLEEFGYMKDGVMVREMNVPDLDDVYKSDDDR